MTRCVGTPRCSGTRGHGDQGAGQIFRMNGHELLRAVSEHWRDSKPCEAEDLQDLPVARTVNDRWTNDGPGKTAPANCLLSGELTPSICGNRPGRLISRQRCS